jgi:hypothetical protein
MPLSPALLHVCRPNESPHFAATSGLWRVGTSMQSFPIIPTTTTPTQASRFGRSTSIVGKLPQRQSGVQSSQIAAKGLLGLRSDGLVLPTLLTRRTCLIGFYPFDLTTLTRRVTLSRGTFATRAHHQDARQCRLANRRARKSSVMLFFAWEFMGENAMH